MILKRRTVQVVAGIGGFFFRAQDPPGLARWYREHLGFAAFAAGMHGAPWQQEAGPTVFAPFDESTSYFGRAENRWMVNCRVRDLAALVSQLRGAGISVESTAALPERPLCAAL